MAQVGLHGVYVDAWGCRANLFRSSLSRFGCQSPLATFRRGLGRAGCSGPGRSPRYVSELGAGGVGVDPLRSDVQRVRVGYRAWRVGSGGLLWPLSDVRRAWRRGVNTARCNCETGLSLSFEWALVNGQRVLERAPAHDAPAEACACGLYSWRRPKRMWGSDDRYVRGDLVAGAVASWGRVQVHETGLRAEHACIVTLSFPATIGEAARARLSDVAERYHVDLVALNELEAAASVHGSPLPDTLMPPRDDTDEHPDERSPSRGETSRIDARRLTQQLARSIGRSTAFGNGTHPNASTSSRS